jgi:cytochrome d ubiquinol oxidase subunit II
LWTNLFPSGEVGIIDWYTLLAGAASLFAWAEHGSLWVVLKTEGSLQERTCSFGAKCWPGLVVITVIMSVASFKSSRT